MRGRFSYLVALGFLITLPLAAQPYSVKLFQGMKWRLIGPFRGGRVLAVTGVAGEPNVYYFGAVAGGVWKTTDGGVAWKPMFDKEPIASIGAIAVAPSDPNVIYVGTGESCIRGDISYGDGVYKSTDAGKTWTNVGLKDTHHIAKIVIDPANPDVVYVAALGHAYGPNAERGVFKTTDGGKTWSKVLYKDDKTGAIDLVMDPNNSRILYAALWQAHRTPWSLVSGGPGSGLYKSTDAGVTWKKIEGKGWPQGILGKIGVAVPAADSERVYAQVEAEQGGLYRSDDAGATWALINPDHRFRQRAWYFTHIFADPKAKDTIYELNVSAYRSTDGGKTFKKLPVPHSDNHGLWIDPHNPERMIEGNDGGATISTDGGLTWTAADNQPTAQFYRVTTDNRFPYYVYGAQQDNSTVAIASASDNGVIARQNWYQVGGGESGYIAPYLPDPNIVYAGSYEGVITRFDKRTEQERVISPWPEVTDGEGAASLKYRFNWTAPIVASPQGPNTLYYAGNVLFKTTDGGSTWTVISPDLTRNDKAKQANSGGPITKDDTGTEYYDTIFTVAPSPLEKGLIWVGSDDGLVHLTRDGGLHWTDVTPKGLPAWSLISLIEASPFDAGTAYMAVDRHELEDMAPYIYRTTDYGQTWTRINQGIPTGAYVHAVREDPKRQGLLFAGTERGVYVSFDDGGRWQPLQLNLPVCPVYDLAVKGSDLIAATHGRSFWILDDLTPLRQMNGQIASAPAHLFDPRTAYRLRGWRGPKKPVGVGQNPPAGAILDYTLAAAPKKGQAIALQILDSQGKLVRKFTSVPPKPKSAFPPETAQEKAKATAKAKAKAKKNLLPAKAGLNRFVWDLRYPKPRQVPGMSAVFSDWPLQGPWVLPGQYKIELTVGGKTYSAPLTVKLDPRIKNVTLADLEKQLYLAQRIQKRINESVDITNQTLALRSQLAALGKRLGEGGKYQPIVAAAARLDRQLNTLENQLVDPRIKSSEDSLNYPVKLRYKLVALEDIVESADAAPTQASTSEFQSLSRRLNQPAADWQTVQAKGLPALNGMIRAAKIPPIGVPAGASSGKRKPRR
jgi:photosystem II stability/assembly factor-like uncharacterized protein